MQSKPIPLAFILLFSFFALFAINSELGLRQQAPPQLPAECSQLPLPEKDDCIAYFAYSQKNQSLCELASSGYTRSFCLIGAASATGNPSLCLSLPGSFTETTYSPDSPVPCLIELALSSRDESVCDLINSAGWGSYCSYRLALKTGRSELCGKVLASYKTDALYSEELFATNLRDYCFARLTALGSAASCSHLSDKSSRTICNARANLNLSECEESIFPLWNVECVIAIASHKSDPSLCSSISAPQANDWSLLCSAVVKKDASACAPIETQHIRDGCYSDVAKVTADPSPCLLMKTYLDRLSCLKELS